MDIDPLTLLAAGLSHCVVVVDRDGELLLSLLLAGLVGSTTHCVGMCGPFVLAQVSARLEAVPAARMTELHRLTGAALLPYHCGRATTYCSLGVLAAWFGGGLARLTGFAWLSAGLLGLAALFFLLYGLRGIVAWLPAVAGKPGTTATAGRPGMPAAVAGGEGWLSRRVSRWVRPLFTDPTGWRGYLLGLALGMIPCGLVYGALSVAAAAGDPWAGALGMAAFSLGTVPALLAVGLAGHCAGRLWRDAVAWAAPLIMVANAVVLAVFAWRLA